MPNTGQIRKRLMRRRWNLLHRYQDEIERVDEELEHHVGDEVELATDQWDARVMSAISDSDARALAEVVAAIRRIDEGHYGLCLTCGCRIERARLEVLPATEVCIECAHDGESFPARREPGGLEHRR